MLFVISAPSGAGKTTIIKELFKLIPSLKFSVSATTRKKRQEESEGKDYHFLTDREFDEKIKKGDFVEWEIVFGNRYGTLKKEVEKYLTGSSHVVFDVDVNGAISIKNKYPEAVMIFINVPVKLLLQRLKTRNTESEEQIMLRNKRIELESKLKDKFDHVIDNSGSVDKAVNELKKLINKYNQPKS